MSTKRVRVTFEVDVEVPDDWSGEHARHIIEEHDCAGSGPVGDAISDLIEKGESTGACWGCAVKSECRIVDAGHPAAPKLLPPGLFCMRCSREVVGPVSNPTCVCGAGVDRAMSVTSNEARAIMEAEGNRWRRDSPAGPIVRHSLPGDPE